jgi:hypothetical protein
MNQQISTSLTEVPGFPIAATMPSAAHSRRCTVCHHPDRIWIELKFIEWGSPTRIAEEFELYDCDSIYHHAHATGLFELRRRNILCVHERLLERLTDTPITSRGLMLAIERLERSVRSRLPNPAAEIDTTITRNTELIFDPKSASRRHIVEQPDPEITHQAANSDATQRQHTPTDVPDSNQPETPDSRQSFIHKMPVPTTRTVGTWAERAAKVEMGWAQTLASKRKPPA